MMLVGRGLGVCDPATVSMAAPPPGCHYEGPDPCNPQLICGISSKPPAQIRVYNTTTNVTEPAQTTEIPWWLSSAALERVGSESINVFGFAVPTWLIGVAVIGGGILLLRKK
jgi:hypothetical protein